MATEARTTEKLPPGPLEWLGRLLWRWLNSLPVAIYVMLALAVLSAIGTVIPQEHIARPEGGATHEDMYTERFGPALWHELELGSATLRLPGSRFALIQWLGLTKIYFTWYFFLLFSWLCISAAVCNVVRYRRTLRLWKEPPLKRSRAFFEAEKRSLSLPAAGSAQFAAAADELKRRGYRLKSGEYAGGQCLYADKGFMHKWWMVVLHIAVLVLLFGGIYGKSLGVEGLIDLADGEEKTLTLDLAANKHRLVRPLLEKLPLLEYRLNQGEFRIDWERHLVLPQWVKKENAAVQEYETYFVDDYVSSLSAEVLRTGEKKTHEVEVNHPLIIDRLALYQSSYIQNGYASIEMGGRTTEQAYPAQIWLVLTNAGLMSPEEAVGSNMPFSTEAIMLEQVKGGRLYRQKEEAGEFGPMTLVRRADFMSGEELPAVLIDTEKGHELKLSSGQTATLRLAERVDNISVFSYKRDPGMPVLYLGWVLMIIGVAFALYTPFTQVWLRQDDKGACLLLTGRGSQKNSPLMAKLHAILSAPGQH